MLYKKILPLLTLCIILTSCGRKYSISEITADNYRTLLKEPTKTIDESDISSSTLIDLKIFKTYMVAEQDNGVNKITRVQYDDYLQIQQLSKENYIKTVTNWPGPNYDKLQSCHFYDYYMSNNNLATTTIELKRIIDRLITKEGFSLKQSDLKNGNDILIKETDDKFVIMQIVGSYANNDIISLSVGAYKKSK